MRLEIFLLSLDLKDEPPAYFYAPFFTETEKSSCSFWSCSTVSELTARIGTLLCVSYEVFDCVCVLGGCRVVSQRLNVVIDAIL